MADVPGTTPIQSVYAQRIAADLENNRAEQQKVSEQIAELTARLEQLRADEEWLCGLQQGTAPPAEASPGAGRAAAQETALAEDGEGGVPQQRQQEPDEETAPGTEAAPGAAQKTTKKAAAKSGGRAAARGGTRKSGAKKKTAAKKAAPAQTAAPRGKAAGPSLRELAGQYLARQSEPRSVAEVTGDLRAAHPERALSPQLVRNALEKLVATGAAERSKQGSSVYYTPASPQADTSQAAQTQEPQQADQSQQPDPAPEPAAADA
jgi:hypothetical protein